MRNSSQLAMRMIQRVKGSMRF
uniref:Uncharacterized protein n=1 Tax=Arundo donax TaxID=35708 RepID=A0A0A9HJS5_ARUDO